MQLFWSYVPSAYSSLNVFQCCQNHISTKQTLSNLQNGLLSLTGISSTVLTFIKGSIKWSAGRLFPHMDYNNNGLFSTFCWAALVLINGPRLSRFSLPYWKDNGLQVKKSWSKHSSFNNIHADERAGNWIFLKFDDATSQVSELQNTEGPMGQGDCLGWQALWINAKLKRIIIQN